MQLNLPGTPSQPEGCEIIEGDALEVLRNWTGERFQCCVTSPPYWGLRDYGISEQIGAEPSLGEYIASLTAIFSEVRRLLTDDGTLWLNIGDGYTSGGRTWRAPDAKNKGRAMSYRPDTPEGLKPKDLLGTPWKLAFALQSEGWFLRSDIIWHKPNCQPESVRDRPTRSHEYLFLLTKSERYHYDYEAVREPTDCGGKLRNRRSVWSVNTQPYPEAHFATFPPALVQPCILAGTRVGDLVLDPFFGSGTVGEVCLRLRRRFVGIELSAEYASMARKRLSWSHEEPRP